MTADRSYTVEAADSVAAQAIARGMAHIDGCRTRTVKRVVLVDPPVQRRDARYRVTLAVEDNDRA